MKIIDTLDGRMIWCNRHEVYEYEENFKSEKSPECKLAMTHWVELSKAAKIIDAKKSEAIDQENWEEVAKLQKAYKEAEVARSARFDHTADMKTYPEVEGYNYELKTLEYDEKIHTA